MGLFGGRLSGFIRDSSYSNMAFESGIPIEPMEGLGLGASGFGAMDEDMQGLAALGSSSGAPPPPTNDMGGGDIGFDWTDL
ncbi:Uncharacterized protein FKW44_018296 [Caligus rogercresseyi]|uniref:Uncharacterized protein n=1 Tax=Caligus rogercresseyi TaxID=217165 RepID=A0A7T8GU74_CALRO|nr:Uncharacterized protein FKW44_018296 [Caligus rogercresseyi]